MYMYYGIRRGRPLSPLGFAPDLMCRYARKTFPMDSPGFPFLVSASSIHALFTSLICLYLFIFTDLI